MGLYICHIDALCKSGQHGVQYFGNERRTSTRGRKIEMFNAGYFIIEDEKIVSPFYVDSLLYIRLAIMEAIATACHKTPMSNDPPYGE